LGTDLYLNLSVTDSVGAGQCQMTEFDAMQYPAL
jgi:hypothetical protein